MYEELTRTMKAGERALLAERVVDAEPTLALAGTVKSIFAWTGGIEMCVLAATARIGAMVRNTSRRERRRGSRLLCGHSLARACDVVCASYGVERAELSRRGSPHPARAALAYSARRRTAAINSDLMVVLGLSRLESVPNRTRRFETMLSSDPSLRERYEGLEEVLDGNHSVPVLKTTNYIRPSEPTHDPRNRQGWRSGGGWKRSIRIGDH
jgi:hypothetical protein